MVNSKVAEQLLCVVCPWLVPKATSRLPSRRRLSRCSFWTLLLMPFAYFATKCKINLLYFKSLVDCARLAEAHRCLVAATSTWTRPWSAAVIAFGEENETS